MAKLESKRHHARTWLPGLLLPLVWLCAVIMTAAAGAQGRAAAPVHEHDTGWKIPPNAATEKNPLPISDATIAAGKKIFSSKCQRCHGTKGKGDGPDADKKHREHMNLTSPDRSDENPDGVIFYRVWNGRSSPKMPTFSEQLTKEQVWAVVTYVQTLRGK